MALDDLSSGVRFPGLADRLHAWGIRPTQVTIAGVGCSLVAAGLVVASSVWTRYALSVAAVFIGLALLADGLDGDLARRHDLETDVGAFVDFTGDKVSDILVYGSLTAICSVPLAGFAAITGDLLISGISAKYETLSGTYVKAGIGSRGGGHVTLAVGVFVTPLLVDAVEWSVPELLAGLLAVLAVLKYVTVVQRLRRIYPGLSG